MGNTATPIGNSFELICDSESDFLIRLSISYLFPDNSIKALKINCILIKYFLFADNSIMVLKSICIQ